MFSLTSVVIRSDICQCMAIWSNCVCGGGEGECKCNSPKDGINKFRHSLPKQRGFRVYEPLILTARLSLDDDRPFAGTVTSVEFFFYNPFQCVSYWARTRSANKPQQQRPDLHGHSDKKRPLELDTIMDRTLLDVNSYAVNVSLWNTAGDCLERWPCMRTIYDYTGSSFIPWDGYCV